MLKHELIFAAKVVIRHMRSSHEQDGSCRTHLDSTISSRVITVYQSNEVCMDTCKGFMAVIRKPMYLRMLRLASPLARTLNSSTKP